MTRTPNPQPRAISPTVADLVLVRPLDHSQPATKKLDEKRITTWADNTHQWNGDVL